MPSEMDLLTLVAGSCRVGQRKVHGSGFALVHRGRVDPLIARLWCSQWLAVYTELVASGGDGRGGGE